MYVISYVPAPELARLISPVKALISIVPDPDVVKDVNVPPTTSIIGIGLIQLKKIETTQYIPFGTFLSLGAIVVWLQGLLFNFNLFAV